MTKLQLRETTTTLTESVTQPTAATLAVQLISPGWGSSGYYSAGVLTEAAHAQVFPAGTHMYLDHPTATEDSDRPERSVRDLAAVLTSDAAVDAEGALVAEAAVFPEHREWIAAAKDAVGLSIRAAGTAELGEAEGRQGQIITALTEGISVDFVTRAGRGGKVLSLLESARPAASLVEAHGMTANDLRDALHTAVRDAHGSNDGDNRVWTWLRDHADNWVVFDVEAGSNPGLYRQAYTVTDGAVTLTGASVEVQAHTTYLPVGDPPPVPVPPPPADVTTEESHMTEQEARELRESAATATTERDAALRRLAVHNAREAGRGVVRAALAESRLPEAARTRVSDQVLTDPPLTQAGQLDESALTGAVSTAVQAETAYIESLSAASPAGQVFGLGGGTAAGEVTDAQLNESIARAFGRPTPKVSA